MIDLGAPQKREEVEPGARRCLGGQDLLGFRLHETILLYRLGNQPLPDALDFLLQFPRLERQKSEHPTNTLSSTCPTAREGSG